MAIPEQSTRSTSRPFFLPRSSAFASGGGFHSAGRGFGGDELYSPSCQRLTRARPLLAPAAFHPGPGTLPRFSQTPAADTCAAAVPSAQGKLDLPLLAVYVPSRNTRALPYGRV